MSQIERITVRLGPNSYEIFLGDGLFQDAALHIEPLLEGERVFVVTDKTVAGFYLQDLLHTLAAKGIHAGHFEISPGEGAKSFDNIEAITGAMLDFGLERKDMVLALGGGVVGDIAGFAASILKRGVDVVQIPTTLLAQIDSAIGGKTGINTAHGKNLIGSFHQPRMVLMDPHLLQTLPARELRAGYGEVVKYGIIQDAAFFHWLEDHGGDVLGGQAAARFRAIKTCAAIKAGIVADDVRESGVRAILNFGHTFGHAIEAACGYGDAIRHGEAVAIGMVMAMDLSRRLGHCSAEETDRLRHHLAVCGLPTDTGGLALKEDIRALYGRMNNDKKAEGGQPVFILCREIGDCFASRDVPETVVLETLAASVKSRDAA